MSRFEIHCPGCNAPLRVSAGSLGKKGRCPGCGVCFPIRPAGPAFRGGAPDPNDTVLGWLSAGDDDRIASASAGAAAPPARLAPARFTARTGSRPTSPGAYPIRLEHVDRSGATFRFFSRLLYDENFRAIFPQQCLVCSSGQDLSVHTVIWGPRFQPRVVPLPIKLRHLGELRGRALLHKLAPQRDLPEPYSLPMPYYICGACPAADALAASVTRQEHEECSLKIVALAPAEAFLAAARGMDCDDLLRIRRARPDRADPWLLLPTGVRIRLAQWYKPHKGERFQAFIADQEVPGHEDGHAGIVLTDRRMVCHKSMRDVEIPLAEPIRLEVRDSGPGGNVRLEVASDTGRQAWFLVPQAGMRQLQEAVAKFRAE